MVLVYTYAEPKGAFGARGGTVPKRALLGVMVVVCTYTRQSPPSAFVNGVSDFFRASWKDS